MLVFHPRIGLPKSQMRYPKPITGGLFLRRYLINLNPEITRSVKHTIGYTFNDNNIIEEVIQGNRNKRLAFLGDKFPSC